MKITKNLLTGFIRRNKRLHRLMPGIRFKYSFFIGIFITFILAAATYINYLNQSSILEKNFNDQTENSLNYINPIVNSIDSIRANLLLIEEMKIRVNEKSEDLKKYKTYALKRKDSVTNSFKSFGKKLGIKVKYDYYVKGYDSYYSTYLSRKDIALFENKIADQLKQSDGSKISSSEFIDIQKKANKVMTARIRINTLQQQLESDNERINSLPETDKTEIDKLRNSIRQIEAKLTTDRKRTAVRERLLRNRLNRYYNIHLKRIEDSGIYNNNIRIVTYNTSGDVNSDTGSYFKDSLVRFAPLFDNKIFEKDKSDFFSSIDILSSINIHEYNYTTEKKFYHVRYVPVFKNSATSERISAIIKEIESNSGNWMKFLKEDSRISAEIANAVNSIRNRLNLLRESKKVPGKDDEFLALYASYNKLLDSRDKAFKQYAPYSDAVKQISVYYEGKIINASDNLSKEIKLLEGLKSDKSALPDELKDETEARETAIEELKEEIKKLTRDRNESIEDIRTSDKLSSRNAMRFLRDTALFDYAILKQKADPSAYRDYMRSSKKRDIEAARWSTLREWIMTARSETILPVSVNGMKNVKLAEDGVLAYSRSEIEEYMWKIDSTPIAGKLGLMSIELENGIAEELLAENLTGFHGVFIDKTEGIENIAGNRDLMILYSIITAFIAIVMTYFLSGFMVKRVRNIIDRVKLAGRGNLQIEFPEAGLDEIEDLAVSLNGMMLGLREKEALKGEIAAAGEIQKILLPEKLPSNLEGHYSIGTFYRPMQGVGGDYYDFIELDKNSMFFCIADVSSHGVGPAIVMSMLRAHIHGILRRGITDLKKILLELNRQIFIETPPHIFVTIFTGIIHKDTNEVDYCSAGHLKPVVYRYKKDTVEILNGGGLPVGMDDNDIFADTISVKNVLLNPGDLFFQYTDGVSEAMDDARNLFSEERLYEEIKKYSRKKPDVMIEKIVEAVEIFTGKTILDSSMSELNDDIAMIAIRRLK